MLHLLFLCMALHGTLCSMFLSCFTLLCCFLVSFDCPLMALPGPFHGSLRTLLVALHSSLMLLPGAFQTFLVAFTLLHCFIALLGCLLTIRLALPDTLHMRLVNGFKSFRHGCTLCFLFTEPFHCPLSALLVALHSSLMLHLLFLCMALHGTLCSMFLSGFTLLCCFRVSFDCPLMAL